MTDAELKLQAMNSAAILAAGVMSNREDDLDKDVEIASNETKADNLMAWRIFRIFYHGIVDAVASKEWRVPAVGEPETPPAPPELPDPGADT